MRIQLHATGQTTAFDVNGQQVVEFQQSWLIAWAWYVKAKDGQIVELPNGQRARILKMGEFYNWEMM